MIPGDNNLDTMRLGLEPIELTLNIVGSTAISEITGVDENVTVGDGYSLAMCVGNANDANGGLVSWGVEGFAAEEEDEVVKVDSQEVQGGGEEVINEGWGFPLAAAAEAEPIENSHCG